MTDTDKSYGLKKRPNLIFHAAALLVVIAWGASFVSTKVLLDNNLSPVQIYIIRFIIAYLAILPFCWKRLWANNLRDELLLCLCGVTSGSIYFLAENVALQYTYAANVALLTSTSPLLTTMLIGLFYKNETPAKGVFLGSFIALVGVACVIFNAGFSFHVMPLGDLLALAASLSFAFYSILLRKVNISYDAMFITRKTFFYGIITAIPFVFTENAPMDFHVLLRGSVIVNFLFLSVMCSFIGFALWAKVNDRLGAIKANNYIYLQPVVTLVLSYFILHEFISIIGYLGCALILLGLYVSDKLSHKNKISGK